MKLDLKLLGVLLGVCFIFSVSQKTFACGCDHDKKAEQTSVATKIADAKDAMKNMKDAKKMDATSETHTCAAGEQCEGGKACSCSKDKKSMHKHKDGKPCDCADKTTGKMES
jgi:hypothetical protein